MNSAIPNNMYSEEPTPNETIDIIDKLVLQKRLSEEQFKAMHHLGGTIAAFRRYCGTVKSFRPGGNNRKLHNELKGLLGR